MNNKLRLSLIIWGGIAAVAIIITIIYFALRPQPADDITYEDDLAIPIDLLTATERLGIEELSRSVLPAFLAQSTDEPAPDREARLAAFLSTDSLVPSIPLDIQNTYTSSYVLVAKVSSSTPTSISWSTVESSSVVTSASVTVTYTDTNGAEDTNQQNWFIYFKKEGDKWLVYDLKKWRTAP